MSDAGRRLLLLLLLSEMTYDAAQPHIT